MSKEFEKWHKKAYSLVFEQGGTFEITGEGNGQVIKSVGTVFKSYEREAQIIFDWHDDFCFDEKGSEVELRIMSATSETEYCTELHIVHKNLETLSEEEVAIYKVFWKNILEDMRKSVNGDWIIKDSELTFDCFK